MSIRPLLAAALVGALAGCGGSAERREVRILAPPDLVENVASFERRTGCATDVRAYGGQEDLDAIAERRNVDVLAVPVDSEAEADDVVELARVRAAGVEVTIPRRLAAAYGGNATPAGRRLTAWRIRPEAENQDCARRWVAYANAS